MIPLAGVLLTPDEAEYIVRALDLFAAHVRQPPPRPGTPTPKLLAVADKLRQATASAKRNARTCPSCAERQRDSGDADDYVRVSTAEAARILGITGNGVRDLARRGVLPSERAAGRWLYPAGAVVRRAEHRAAQRN